MNSEVDQVPGNCTATDKRTLCFLNKPRCLKSPDMHYRRVHSLFWKCFQMPNYPFYKSLPPMLDRFIDQPGHPRCLCSHLVQYRPRDPHPGWAPYPQTINQQLGQVRPRRRSLVWFHWWKLKIGPCSTQRTSHLQLCWRRCKATLIEKFIRQLVSMHLK